MSCKQTNHSTNGLGSIRKQERKRKDGSIYEYWEGRLTLSYDPTTKKQIVKTFTGASREEVLGKMHSCGIEPSNEVQSNSPLLKVWLETWQSEYLEGVKPSTAYLYGQDIALYILPSLGNYRLDELTTTVVQRFYNKLLHPPSERKPLSSKTIRCIHGVLHQALDQAVNAGEMESNPSSSCKLPKVKRKEITPLEDSQIKSFLDLIKGHPHEYLYKITLFTGLREGEVLGLTWDCLDMKHGILTVKQQLRREQKKGGQYYFSSTKNDKKRTIALSPSLVRLFRYQKQQQLLRKAEAAEWVETNLVFTNAKGGFLSYRTVYDCFKRIVKKMGCPELRFHDLRHQYAVIAIKNGDDIKTIQGNLGHATAAFTLDVYGHVTEEMKRDSADRMENYYKALSEL